MIEKPALAGLLPKEISRILEKIPDSNIPDYRCRQIFQWITRGTVGFSEMKNLPLPLREILEEKCSLYSSAVSAEFRDRDGTSKIQISLEDGCLIEAVTLNDGKGRKTACISTQAGCAGGCLFCKTGTLGFKRNLTAGEMAEEFLFLKRRDPEISHIVIMGMGEPLLNLEELRKTLVFFMDQGLGISKKRITLSTAGISEGILDLADNGPDIRLALSLTSARQEIREKLMPLAKTNPLSVLKKNLEYYQKKNKRRITLEAVLLKGINTGEEEADAMAGFTDSLDTVLNLIPWNPWETKNQTFQPPSAREINLFISALEKRKIKTTLRMGKGCNIGGACGQLGAVLDNH